MNSIFYLKNKKQKTKQFFYFFAETPLSPQAEVSRPDESLSAVEQRILSLEKQLYIELKVSWAHFLNYPHTHTHTHTRID